MMRNLAGHILVVEDSDEDFDTLRLAARHAGVAQAVHRAVSGDDCLTQLHAAGNDLPVLIVLDLNTPQGDGREALQNIKSDERLRATPVVVLSTSTSPRDVDFCYSLGANAYHLKPVSHPAHLQVLQGLFGYWLAGAVLPDTRGRARP